MVKRLINLLHKEWGNLHEAALLLGIMALFSQILGFLRDRILASTFGAGQTLDIYYSAFRVPDFLYDTIGSAVAITVLVPFIAEYAKKGEGELKKFMSIMFTAFMITFMVICVLAFILMPKIVPLLVPGFSPEQQALNINIARILLLSPILQGLSNLYGAITQSLQRFFIYAISPAIYNIGIIFGVIFLYPAFGIYGLAWGVVFGALLQDLIQLPVLIKEKLVPGIRFGGWSEIKKVVRTSIPRTIALTSSHIATIAIIGIASHINGGVAVFSFAMTLQGITFTIIGSSYSVAAFPTFAKHWANGHHDKFRDLVTNAARHIIFWSLPITALFVVIRAQIVRVILGSGQFDWNATRLVAAALAIFVISVVAQSLVSLFTRAFYATGNNKIPLIINASSSLFIVLMAYVFTNIFNNSEVFKYFIETILRVDGIPGTSVLMLPLAYSLGMLINATILVFYINKKVGGIWINIHKSLIHSFSVAVIMGLVAYYMLQYTASFVNQTTLLGIMIQGGLSGTVAFLVGTFFFGIIGNEEYLTTKEALRHKFWKKKPIAIEHETLIS